MASWSWEGNGCSSPPASAQAIGGHFLRQAARSRGGPRQHSQARTHPHAHGVHFCVSTCLSLNAIGCHSNSLCQALSQSLSLPPSASPFPPPIPFSLCSSILHCFCPCLLFAVFLSLSSSLIPESVCGLPFSLASHPPSLALVLSLCLLPCLPLPLCLCRRFSFPQPGKPPKPMGLTQDSAAGRQERERPT